MASAKTSLFCYTAKLPLLERLCSRERINFNQLPSFGNDAMYRILLHTGLPKTATTSLQNHVFMPLHESHKIHFLGKKYSYNMFSGIYEKIKDKKLTQLQINSIRANLIEILDKDKLNVISEENLSVSFLSNFEAVFFNLSRLFSSDKIKVLTSIRSPVDFLFSHFVEDYYWRFYCDKKRNTFEKFTSELMHNKNHSEYGMYFYEKYLALLDHYFQDLTVLLFEDLEQDRENYLNLLAGCLSINSAEIHADFPHKKENIKQHTKHGRLSRQLSLGHVIFNYLMELKLFRKYKIPRVLLRRINMPKHLKLIKIGAVVEHQYPSKKTREKLQQLLCIKDDDFARRYRLDAGKLKKYNYYCKSKTK